MLFAYLTQFIMSKKETRPLKRFNYTRFGHIMIMTSQILEPFCYQRLKWATSAASVLRRLHANFEAQFESNVT